MKTVDDDGNASGFQFGKFAAAYFQGHIDGKHSKKSLRTPLLLLLLLSLLLIMK